ncbi:H-NS family nucleoid-associated regulatory protein [Sulfitobacter aestuarii]|uniref:H-NS family nucleoid-associated regulatory protein n=1 Tax=Sulfitobacter aestuarii TaxID=2161676 RepID=A0ABW5U4K9_9RHOB
MDLKSMSRKELETLQQDVQEALVHAEERDRKAAREAAQKAVAEYGFSLDDLSDEDNNGKKTGRRKSGGGGVKSEPKFANPADPNQTWTGKGRQPNWYRAEIEKGTAPESMKL